MSIGRGCSYETDITHSSKFNKPLLKDADLKSYCSALIDYKKSREDGFGGVKNPSAVYGRHNKLPPDCICKGSAAAGGKKKTRKVKKSKNKKTKGKQTKKVKKTRRNRKGKK